MPTEYKRKITGAERGTWTENQLKEALKKVEEEEMTLYKASRLYGIPYRTLYRRKQLGNHAKNDVLGPQAVLGIENEKRLVALMQRLKAYGFAPNRETIRTLAFQLAEKLGLNHRFDKESKKAGYAWLSSFLRRNPELAMKPRQRVFSERGSGMARRKVIHFFEVLSKVFEEKEFSKRPLNIYNLVETCCQLKNDAGTVFTSNETEDPPICTSAEKGENVVVITCCNAETQYLPPAVIFKGTGEEIEFSDGLPPGSLVFMNQHSSAISADIFFRWFKEVFAPRKSQGETLLILDGHASLVNSYDLLEFAENNNIVLVCLPSDTGLQPLDRYFSKSFRRHFEDEVSRWNLHHPGRSIDKIQASEFIGKAWKRAASMDAAIDGFRETGIFPLDLGVKIVSSPLETRAVPDRLAPDDRISEEAELPQSSQPSAVSAEQGCSYTAASFAPECSYHSHATYAQPSFSHASGSWQPAGIHLPGAYVMPQVAYSSNMPPVAYISKQKTGEVIS